MNSQTIEVQFRRYGPEDSEILPENFTLADMFAQLRAEFAQAGIVIGDAVESERIGEWDFFLCRLPWHPAIVDYLQTAYDEWGIAGYFETDPKTMLAEKIIAENEHRESEA